MNKGSQEESPYLQSVSEPITRISPSSHNRTQDPVGEKIAALCPFFLSLSALWEFMAFWWIEKTEKKAKQDKKKVLWLNNAPNAY